MFGVYGCGNYQRPASARYIKLTVLWVQPCRLHTVLLSFLQRLTNESMGWNNASAEPETRGEFSTCLLQWSVKVGALAPLVYTSPLSNMQGFQLKKKMSPLFWKERRPWERYREHWFVLSCIGSRQLGRPLTMGLRWLEAHSSYFKNISLVRSYHVSSAGASVAEHPPPPSHSAATAHHFVQLDQSPDSCVLGFHLPHSAAPSLPVASSSLLVIFLSPPLHVPSCFSWRNLFSNSLPAVITHRLCVSVKECCTNLLD